MLLDISEIILAIEDNERVLTWCRKWDRSNFGAAIMVKFLTPELIGEGYVYEKWVQFKKFEQFLLAVGKVIQAGSNFSESGGTAY